MKKDTIYFLNISEKYRYPMRKAIKRGLLKIRRALRIKRPVEILIYWSDRTKGLISDGTIFDKDTIVIEYDIKRFANQRTREKRLKQLEATIIHELVHCLRARKKQKTLLEAIVNEGIAIFVETYLAFAPPYLDLKGTYIEDIKKWWRWWSKKYFSLSLNNEKYDFFENRGFREACYRIGYYIVSTYVDAHPAITFRGLINISTEKLTKYSRKIFH